MEEHDNTMDKNNRIESIVFKISVAIGTQNINYYYNGEFWDSIWNLLLFLLFKWI